jgi:hypothetical protein
VAQPTIADAAASIRDELRRRRTHLVRHGTQSLEQHLCNTFHILSAWQQPPHVQYAGLLHSAYSTDVFNHRTFSFNERDRVRALVGEGAEQLVYLFCVIDRRQLLSVLRESTNDATKTLELVNRLDGHPVHLTRADAGDLLTIYMANAAEQSCRRDLSPARWLSNVSILGQQARARAQVTPPVFDGCTTVVSAAEENQLLADYEHLVTRLGKVDDSTELNQRRGRKPSGWPAVAEPLVWLALHEIGYGTVDNAREFGQVAAARLQQWATPWDKRLDTGQWQQLCGAIADETKADELAFVVRRTTMAAQANGPSPQRLYLELARNQLLPNAFGATSDNRRRFAGIDTNPEPLLPARFQTYIAGLRTNAANPRMTRYPGLRAIPWHDPQQFRLVRDLEEVADEVAAEVRALPGSGFQEEAENINRSGRWSVLFLYERGRKNERNCSLCPQTVKVIEANRTVLSLGGLAYFSMLEPNTQIAPHTGPTNVRLRCHLGINVPEGCGLRVGGIERTWQEGRCVVFDDSFTHEAWNHSEQPRVVLVVDLWHPDLTDDEVTLLNGMHRYATASGTGLVRYWNRNRRKAAATNDQQTPG